MATPSSPPAPVLIGVAGWSYDDWSGPVYPRPRPRGFHPLAFLARFVDVMEINSTFYALPKAEHAARWVSLVEHRPGFRFLVKLHRGFTHESWPQDATEQARRYWSGIAPLQESGRLLGLLAQFSARFRAGDVAWRRLDAIRTLLPHAGLTCELRHRSFFDEASLRRIADLGFSLAHIDVPSSRDHPPRTHRSVGPLGWVRLHGRNDETWFDRRAHRDQKYDYLYDAQELEQVGERLARIRQESERVVVVLNNHFRGQAVANALQLKRAVTGKAVPAPDTLVAAFPGLATDVEVVGQQRLF